MNASFRRPLEPLSPPLLSSPSSFSIPHSRDRITLWPLRLRRKLIVDQLRADDLYEQRQDLQKQEFFALSDAAATSDKASQAESTSPLPMTVADVMTRDVISVSTVTPISEIARVLVGKRISAVPVLGVDGKILGIVSESDLIRRVEIGTGQTRSWWHKIIADIGTEAAEYVRTHGRKARHVMNTEVVTATENMTLVDVADLMEKRRLKRLPVVRKDILIGIVSRSDLVKALARHRSPLFADPPTDGTILKELMTQVKELSPSHRFINISVHQGNADISGLVDSSAEREAILVATENTPGIRSIQDRLRVRARSIS